MTDPIREALETAAEALERVAFRCTNLHRMAANQAANAAAIARAALAAEPPAPDHIPGATEMVPAGDGEREELAQWLEKLGDNYDDLYRPTSDLVVPKLTRAAALLRQPAPAPVPVAERPWERKGWCDAEGRCWWRDRRDPAWWTKADPRMVHDGWLLPHWAIPQPPQGGEVAE